MPDGHGFRGTEGDDIHLRSDPGRHFVNTLDGNDITETNDGADNIIAGEGQDHVTSGKGNDTIRAGHGDDWLSGGMTTARSWTTARRFWASRISTAATAMTRSC